MAVIQKDVFEDQSEGECNAFHHEVCSLLRITKTEHLHLYESLRTDGVPSIESNAAPAISRVMPYYSVET
jgi:hypothetical protein